MKSHTRLGLIFIALMFLFQCSHVSVIEKDGIKYAPEFTGSYWMEPKIQDACTGYVSPSGSAICEVIGTQCTPLQYGIRHQFIEKSHIFRFSATDYVTEEKAISLLKNCSISNNTFLFKNSDLKCIAGAISKLCDSYNLRIGENLQSILVELDRANGCEFPGTFLIDTFADPNTGLYHFTNLPDGIYKIRVSGAGCTFTPVTTNVVTIPLSSAQAYDFIGSGTGLCACTQLPSGCVQQ